MTKRTPRNCREYSPELESYADGELSAARRRDLENHLATCGECRAQLEEIEATRAVVQSALSNFPRITPRADFDLRVLAKIAARRQFPLMDFCDRLDQVFSRPLPKILGSSFLGITFGLVFALLLVSGASTRSQTAHVSASYSARTATPDSTIPLYAFGRTPEEVALLRELTDKKTQLPAPKPQKEPLWNDDFSASPRSSARGSLC